MSEPTPSDTTAELARRLPKVLLHEHLDGGLRVATLFELLQARGLATPARSVAELQTWFAARANAGSLERYLEGFALTVAAMATPEALRRVAREAADDAHADGALLAEFRIAPLLFEAHGLSAEAATEAMLEGLAEAPMPCGLIVCAMRHLPPQQTLRAARLALRYQHAAGPCRVLAFDLAGAEAGHPPDEHAAALALVREQGLPMTLHAGEADVAERVLQAAQLGAARVGHGVRLADALQDPERQALVQDVIARGVHLEVCPTSNVHTGAAASIATHPITALWRAGVSLSYHTDNRLMSCITHSSEAAALLVHTPLQASDLLQMARLAARASFLAEAHKAEALAAIDAAASAAGTA